MTVEEGLKKYKEKYPNVPYKIVKNSSYLNSSIIISQKNNKLHSYGDAPAYVNFFDNSKQWYKENNLHRENDKPAVIYPSEKQWYYNGKKHRENDKPARMTNDGKVKEWWYKGKRHRENDKPAVVTTDRKEWWYKGKQYDPNAYEKHQKSNKQINS